MTTLKNVHRYAQSIVFHAVPVLKISGVGGRRWKRNVAKGARIGPWLQGHYDVLNAEAWQSKGACLYLVTGKDLAIRYVGISRNGLKHRWRTSPAYDAETMDRLPQNQLFHSQCWKHIEIESTQNPDSHFEVRVISAEALLNLIEKLGPPLSGFAVLRGDGEGIVAGVERWLCNNRDNDLARWNVSMTGA